MKHINFTWQSTCLLSISRCAKKFFHLHSLNPVLSSKIESSWQIHNSSNLFYSRSEETVKIEVWEINRCLNERARVESFACRGLRNRWLTDIIESPAIFVFQFSWHCSPLFFLFWSRNPQRNETSRQTQLKSANTDFVACHECKSNYNTIE